MTNLGSVLKSRYYFVNKGPYIQNYGFSSSHVWLWELDHKEDWAPKNECFWTVVLEKTLKSSLDGKEIQPVNPEVNQPWIFIRRSDAKAEAEAPIFWPPDVKNWLIEKDPDAGKDWKQEEQGDAAAAAKSLQLCPTLCDPRDGSPPGSPIPGILQARTLEWVAISFSNAWKWKVKVKSLSRVQL